MKYEVQRRFLYTKRRSQHRQGMIYVVLLGLAVIFLAPLVWLVLTALKSDAEIDSFAIQWLPAHAQWNNFLRAVTLIPYGHYLLNSLALSAIYTPLVVLSSAFVGFGFARLRGRGKRFWFMMMLATLMTPPIITLIPTYILFNQVGLINTYWPWVFWGLAGTSFLVFLFRQFFMSIPNDLEEAAILDGCSYFRIFWQLFLPISRPVLATAAILSFTGVWGDYITPSLLLSANNTTLAVALTTGYLSPTNEPYTTVLASGALLYILPVIVIFFFFQRYFVQGIVTSGIKG